MKTYFYLFLIFFCYKNVAQNQNEQAIDSVFITLDTFESPDEKVNFLSTQVSILRYSPQTFPYIRKSEEIALDAASNKLLANTYYYYANYYYYNSKLDSSFIYIEKTKPLIEDKEQPLLRAFLASTEGGVYKLKGNMPKSIAATLESKALLDKANVTELNTMDQQRYKRMILSITNSLANYYNENENYDKALSYYNEGYQLAIKDSLFIPAGVFIGNKGDLLLKKEQYPEALNAFIKGKELKIKGNAPPRMLSVSDLNLGTAYTYLNDYEQAQKYLDPAVSFYEKTNNVARLSEAIYRRGKLHLEKKEFQKAAKDCEISKTLAEKEQIIEYISNACDCLHTAFSALGNNELALLNYKEHIAARDKIFNKKNVKKQTELELTYEFNKTQELKDAELKVLKLESEKAYKEKQLYLVIGIIGAISTILIGFFLYKNKRKNKLLAKQKILLEATVDEKNALLKETHHRVKNSFQIVSSLLYLQSENIQDKEAQLAIKEAQNRVRSMVLIHQKLYNKDQLVGINTKEYIEDLTQDIFESHQFTKLPINYSLEVAPMILDIETITPIGLILNELITNVLKHAFDDVDIQSKMNIIFEEQGENLVLKVSDNGKGMCETIKESSFGIKLIKALSKKLKATLTYSKAEPQGTSAILEISRFQVL